MWNCLNCIWRIHLNSEAVHHYRLQQPTRHQLWRRQHFSMWVHCSSEMIKQKVKKIKINFILHEKKAFKWLENPNKRKTPNKFRNFSKMMSLLIATTNLAFLVEDINNFGNTRRQQQSSISIILEHREKLKNENNWFCNLCF